MAINRISQVTGETVSPNEFIALGGSSAAITSTIKHTGNYSIRFSDQYTARTIAMGLPLLNNFRSNWFLYHNAGSAGAYAVLYLVHRSGQTNYEIDIRWDDATDNIVMKINGVSVATVSAVIAGIAANNTWIPIGLHVESGASGKVILYVDGLEVLRYEGLVGGSFDYVTACGTWPEGLITAGWAASAYLDDWYVDELTAGNISEASPPSPGWMSSVVTNRRSVEWLPFGAVNNDECIDDIGPHDGDLTYVYTTQTGEMDIYALSNIDLPDNYVIDAVVPYAIARKTDAGIDGRLRFFAFNGLNESDGGAPFLPVSYRPVYGRILTQPTGARWTEGVFNGMGFGFESVGDFE